MKKQILCRFIFCSGILAGAMLLAACSVFSPTPEAKPQSTAPAAGSSSAELTAEGRVVPGSASLLSFALGGEISQIAVTEGQTVLKDTLLMSLGKREPQLATLSADKLTQTSSQKELNDLKRLAEMSRSQAAQGLADAQKTLPDAQKVYDDVFTSDFNKKVDDKEVALQSARDKLKDAQETLDKYLNLDKENQVRKDAQKTFDNAQLDLNKAVRERDLLKNQQDQAKAGLDVARARLVEAQYNLDQRLNGPDPTQLALIQARLDAANDQAAAAQRALANMDLKAPYDGTVMEIRNVSPGDAVVPGQVVITFADAEQWVVDTKDLTEIEVVRLEEGQKVTLTPDAIPELKLNGTVTKISRTFTEKSGDILYTVRIKLSASDPRLRWGMTVKIVFYN